MKANLKKKREKRGKTEIFHDQRLASLSSRQLIKLLKDSDPQLRTSSAKLLGERRTAKVVAVLSQQLKKEQVIYPRIAISEALSRMGEMALKELIPLLGKIGKNQHRNLPKDIFKKWNYPYPRDVIARTIAKMGPVALPYLVAVLRVDDETAISEAVDAIGHISFYNKDQTSLLILLETLKKHETNQVIVWKVIRALEAFESEKAIKALESFLLKSKIPVLRWEAARSLGQIRNDRCQDILKKALKDEDERVCRMVKLALERIADR